MNVRMWQHAATQANIATLRARGVTVIDPDEGPMACGEYGPGRLPEPEAILSQILPGTGRWQREALTEGAPSTSFAGPPPPCFAQVRIPTATA